MTKLTTIATCAGLLAGAVHAQDAFKLEAPVRLEAGGVVIDTGGDIGHAGPSMFDRDGDGKLDLLVSSFRGSIRVFANVGTARAPEFAEKEPLQAGGEPIRIHNW